MPTQVILRWQTWKLSFACLLHNYLFSCCDFCFSDFGTCRYQPKPADKLFSRVTKSNLSDLYSCRLRLSYRAVVSIGARGAVTSTPKQKSDILFSFVLLSCFSEIKISDYWLLQFSIFEELMPVKNLLSWGSI